MDRTGACNATGMIWLLTTKDGSAKHHRIWKTAGSHSKSNLIEAVICRTPIPAASSARHDWLVCLIPWFQRPESIQGMI